MNNEDAQLKLQAYLDGELSAADAAEVQAWLGQSLEADALMAELLDTKAVMAGVETDRKLPESREFFWSKIEREIERQTPAEIPARKISWIAWVQRHLLPVTGVALLCGVMGLAAFRHFSGSSQYGEMDMASDDMGAYTFRDQQAQMTTIWYYNRNDDSGFTDPSTLASFEPE